MWPSQSSRCWRLHQKIITLPENETESRREPSLTSSVKTLSVGSGTWRPPLKKRHDLAAAQFETADAAVTGAGAASIEVNLVSACFQEHQGPVIVIALVAAHPRERARNLFVIIHSKRMIHCAVPDEPRSQQSDGSFRRFPLYARDHLRHILSNSWPPAPCPVQ